MTEVPVPTLRGTWPVGSGTIATLAPLLAALGGVRDCHRRSVLLRQHAAIHARWMPELGILSLAMMLALLSGESWILSIIVPD